jgi:zinc protease
MKRIFAALAGVALAIACAQQQERVRKASEASAEAMRPRDAGVPEEAAAQRPAQPPPAVAQQQPQVAQQQKAPVPEKTAPTVTRGASGIGLLALPLTSKSIVSVQLRFRTGAVDDPPGKTGLTYLTARVMTEGGTKALDAKALLNALFPLAAELETRVDKEQTTFSARVHKDNLSKLLPILEDVLLHPRWDPAEFKRLREMAVNDVEKRLRQGDDENLGKESLSALIYRDHPYGRLTLGHVSDLKSMSLADLQAHAARVFTADRLTVGVAGGYPPRLGEGLAETLASLPPKSDPHAPVPAVHPHGPRFLLVEKLADSTAVSVGIPWALSHQDPDWPAMSIARSAFGEHRQGSGRLFQRLREMRGLNYGDYAYLEHFQQEGGGAETAQLGRPRSQQYFSIWLRPIRNENRLFAVRAALYELARSLKDDPFTPAEVEQTRSFLDGYILLFDQTDARKLGYALDDAFQGMNGFLGTWRASLRDASAEQVNAAWRKWVDPARLEIVLAGTGMSEVKKALLSNAPTPIQYPDARPPLPGDAEIAKFSFGAQGDADVEIVQVDSMFE